MDELTSAVLELVRHQLPAAGDDLDAPLAGYGMNSLRTVSLLVAIEERFGVELPQDLINPDTFDTTRSIAEAVRGTLAELTDA